MILLSWILHRQQLIITIVMVTIVLHCYTIYNNVVGCVCGGRGGRGRGGGGLEGAFHKSYIPR